MGFLKIFLPKQITTKQIEDLYQYSEINKLLGRTDNTNQFGSGFYIEHTREKTEFVYEGIKLYGDKKWGFISIENGKVKYQYTENVDLNYITVCPVTTDEKIISLLSKNFFKWYNVLKLPKSIQTIQKKKQDIISVVSEIKIEGFDEKYPPVLRVLSNKTTFLIFGVFPPRDRKITKLQTDNFDKLLADAIGKKVVHDDRELFIIFDDSQEMINTVISFLQDL